MNPMKNQKQTISKNKDHQEEPCLPLPKPRADTDYVRESQFLLWLWKTIQEISFGLDYEQYLRDGVILCRLMQNLAPDIIGKQKRWECGDDKHVKRENIRNFLDCCQRFGLNKEQLFDVEDLLSMLDMPRVTRCLFALGNHAAEKNGRIPELGKPYDEWLNEQLDNKYNDEDEATKIIRIGANVYRRAGMPLGDDLLVSHVNTEWLKEKLQTRKAKDAARIRRPPRDPLVQRTPSKPLAELKAMFTSDGKQKQQPDSSHLETEI